MLIDPFSPDFDETLRQKYAALPPDAQLLLLIDGVFAPGLFRDIVDLRPLLLFSSFPGFSEKAKDVSPFLVRYDPADSTLARLLKRCNGLPMLSAIITFESADKLAQRLSAWSIVEAGGQRFNFRFPDTRRLPAIFEVLIDQQGVEMIGHGVSWHYVGRDGKWQSLRMKPAMGEPEVTENAELNDDQFRHLVSDSEADELWVLLQYRGVSSSLLPSERHLMLLAALELANHAGLDELMKLRCCNICLKTDYIEDTTIAGRFSQWVLENLRKNDEKLQTIA
jgi:hypothetical protein